MILVRHINTVNKQIIQTNSFYADVSEYTYERTVLMEQRTQVLQSYGNELSVMNSGDVKPDELNVRRM